MTAADRCAKIGHCYAPQADLNGEYACIACHAVKALTAPLPNDQVVEAVS